MDLLTLELIVSGGVVGAAAMSLAKHPALRNTWHAVSGAGAMSAGLAIWLWLAGGAPSFAADGKTLELPPEKPTPTSPSSPSHNDERAFFEIVDSNVIIPPGRPSWVESSPARNGDQQWTAVSSGPYTRRSECVRALDDQLESALNEYIREHLGSDLAPKLLGYTAADARRRLVHDTYEETITVSVGPMHQLHAKLEFSPSFREEIERRWEQWRSASRTGQVGLAFAAIIGFLATTAGFFRLDNATRGYYTGRLQFLAAGAILALVAVGVVAVRLIPWI